MNQYSTNRLLLELVNEKHAEELFPIWSNYDVTRYTMVKEINGVEDCIIRIKRQLGWGSDNGIGPYVIKENGKIIGYCGGRKNQTNEAEIFYHIDKGRWGNGLGTEIAKKLIEIAFDEKRVKKVKAEAAVENAASWKILEKIGMKRIEIQTNAFENKEGLHDFYVYEIEKVENND